MLFFRTLNGSLALLRLCTFSLISGLALIYNWTVLSPWRGQATDSLSSWHFVLFNTALCYIYWTFTLSCQDPGAVLADYVPPAGEPVRYCPKCKAFKPPRTHHCKRCGRCILRMDHHCPWLSSCVGHANHAVFIKFLLAVVPVTGYMTYMTTSFLLSISIDEVGTTIGIVFIIVCACICFMVSCLLFYQAWCAVENITTIESWTQKVTEHAIKRKQIPPIAFPYDLYSVRANLREMFGTGWMIMWFWPTLKAQGSGHSFPHNEDADACHPWPPKIPEHDKSRDLLLQHNDIQRGQSHLQVSEDEHLRSRMVGRNNEDDSIWDDELEDYISDDSDDYVDGDGENLESYGVDDDDEIVDLDKIVNNNVQMAQLIARKRDQPTSEI